MSVQEHLAFGVSRPPEWTQQVSLQSMADFWGFERKDYAVVHRDIESPRPWGLKNYRSIVGCRCTNAQQENTKDA